MNTIPLKIAGRSALSAGTLLLTVMLWLVSFDTASAQDILSRRVSVSFKDETLRGAVDKISTEAAVKINYSIGASVLEKKVTLNASNESLGSVLKRLLTPLSLTYSFFNNEIIIRQLVEKNDNKAAIGNLQQEMVQISGYVTDSAGAPLPGVTVVEKNGNKGAVTDAKGFYTITVPKGSQMVFRMSGYTSHEAEAGDNQPQRIVLKESVGLLKEVVVLAYGQQQKKDITASVATVKGADLVKSTSANISGSLAGRLPGLRAIQRSGEPGEDGASIDIRGFGTALIVVDGVPVNSFSYIDPNEIESISILKDAAAAVYGIRSANGVVLITTKKGSKGLPKISYTGYYSWQRPTRVQNLVTAAQYAELKDESAVNRKALGLTNEAPPYGREVLEKYRKGEPGYENTDWRRLAMKNSAPMFSNNLNVSGGSEHTTYFFSIGQLQQEGIWKSDATRFNRYNFRSNLQSKIGKRLTAELNTSGRIEQRAYPAASTGYILSAINRTAPMLQPYANGNTAYLNNTAGWNALAMMDKDVSGYRKQQNRYVNVIGSLNYDIPFLEGLSAKALYSYQSESVNWKTWNKKYNLYSFDQGANKYNVTYTGNDPGTLTLENAQEDNHLLNFSLNYRGTFARDHHITGLLLFERRERLRTDFNTTREYQLNTLDELLAGTQNNMRNGGDPTANEAYMGYVGRVNYNYADKYLLELAFRQDGSYKFSKSKRWGFFPSVSAGWVISKEKFFVSSIVNNLKLRASWGKLGDDADFRAFQYLNGFYYPGFNDPNNDPGSSPIGYLFGSDVILGFNPRKLANPNLTWYTSYLSNIGVDVGLWDNKLTFQVDAFYRKRTGLLARRAQALPGTFGVEIADENLNDDNNRGFEIVIGHNNHIGELNFNVSGNFTYSRACNGHIEQAPPNNAQANWLNNSSDRWKNIAWGYKSLGQFQNQDEINKWAVQDGQGNRTLQPGDIKYADLDGDGIIDDRDQTVIGRGSIPEIMYGLNVSASYKGFDLYVFFQGAANYSFQMDGEFKSPFVNVSSTYQILTDRWHHQDIYDPTSPWVPGKYPSTVVNGSQNNNRVSDFWLKDASYLRLKNIEIGYSLPAASLRRIGINTLRIYTSGQNLFTWDKLKVVDPEANGADGEKVSGRTTGGYPQQRVVTVGLNVVF